MFKSGFVALVGRASVGKSTLLNACYGGKIAITSRVCQTTRKRLRAVLTSEHSQIILVDTPGLHKPKDALGKELNACALGELAGVDVVSFLLDASAPVGRGDEWVCKRVEESPAPVKLLVLTKADKVNKETLDTQLSAARKLAHFTDEIVVSAKTGFCVDEYLKLVESYLPEGPLWFGEDVDVDARDEDLIAEFIREKILRATKDEIPHSIAVVVEEMVWRHRDLCSIRARIMVEREGQKAIIIGKRGAFIKQIGMRARTDIEKLLGARVFLDLSVEVRPLWRRDAQEIRRLGLEYHE